MNKGGTRQKKNNMELRDTGKYQGSKNCEK